MIRNACRAAVLVFVLILGSTAQAQVVPWQDAEVVRTESAQIQRRLFRTPDAALRKEVEERLERVTRLWSNQLEAAYERMGPNEAHRVAEAVAAFAEAVSRWDPGNAAAARAQIWTAMLDGAFRATLACLEQGRIEDAAAWLNIREYARTSRDTAASIAMREALAGRLEAERARQVIEAELLGIYAGELRRAIAEARSHLATGYGVQLSAALSRAIGLQAMLSDNIASRLESDEGRILGDAFARLAQASPTDGQALHSLVAQIQATLATYAPTSLSADELDRRVRLLARFIGLVPVEYEKGVRDGEITIPFEYFEAGLFRDRAEMLFGDLGYDLAARSPGSFERFTAILAQMRTLVADKGDETVVRSLADEAGSLLADLYGTKLNQGGHEAALSLLPDILNEVLLVSQAGDWEEAELKRLEAYALFDPDIEQRLMPRAPSLALKMEAGFWEGSVAEPGLGRIIADRSPDLLKQTVARMKSATGEAKEVLNTQLSSSGAFLQSLAILLREGLEAVLVLACMVGALKANRIPAAGRGGWRWPLSCGVAVALVGSLVLWLVVGRLFAMSTLQRELLEGATALIAAAVLVYVTHWIFRKAYVGDWVAEIRRKTAAAAQARTGEKVRHFAWFPLFALSFLVVFREGFETVLFYEALLFDAPALPVLAGLAIGGLLAAAVAYAILGLEAKLPVAAFFRLTGCLLALLSIVLIGSGVRGLQTAALLSATPVAWFPDRPWMQLYFGLYPVAEALLAQAGMAALLLLSVIWLLLTKALETRVSNTPVAPREPV